MKLKKKISCSNLYLFGSKRDSGCNQLANLPPVDPGASEMKSFKN
jgi:hypothetical protein